MGDPLPVSVCMPVRGDVTDINPWVQAALRKSAHSQTILETGRERHPNEKRNRAATRTDQPYVFFCDDDVIVAPDCLAVLLNALQNSALHQAHTPDGTVVYAYCDYMTINHPTRKMDIHHAGPFDAERLKRENYISTMSLIDRRYFPGFDEAIDRFQDWDLWLTMLEAGYIGIYVPRVLFAAVYDGNGITQREGFAEAAEIVRRKHGLS